MSIHAILRPLSMIALLACSLPLGAAAQERDPATLQPTAAEGATQARARYLERWLGWMSRARHSSRVTRGVWKLVVAGVFGTSTVVSLADMPERNGPRPSSIALSSGIAVALLADGIVSLSSESTEEERYLRWTLLRVQDNAAISRFEGELAAAAAEARYSERFRGALWIAVAASGATMITATALGTYEATNDAVFYGAGAILLGLGVWRAIVSFTGETWTERAFRLYQERQRPEPAATLSFAPALAAHGGGFTLTGTF